MCVFFSFNITNKISIIYIEVIEMPVQKKKKKKTWFPVQHE